MELKIKKCQNCPFYVWDTDYDAVVHPHFVYCTLSQQMKLPEYTLYIGSKNSPKIEIPEWCPLKQEPITIQLYDKG